MKNKFIKILLLLMFNTIILVGIVFIDSDNLFTKQENKSLIEFKIKNRFFVYKKSHDNNPTYYDYDYFLLNNNYSLKEIYILVSNRPESIFFKLTKYIYENNSLYLLSTDEEIINSLKFLFVNVENNDIDYDSIKIKSIPNFRNIIENNYIKEILNDKKKKEQILKRVLKIEESNEYKKIYKDFFIETFKIYNE